MMWIRHVLCSKDRDLLRDWACTIRRPAWRIVRSWKHFLQFSKFLVVGDFPCKRILGDEEYFGKLYNTEACFSTSLRLFIYPKPTFW